MGMTCATTANVLCIRSGELRGTLMSSDRERATTVAQLAADEATARRVMDVVAESFDPLAAVAGASEDGPDRWTVAIHFRDPPNETAVRALIALAAGPDAANSLAFETTTPQDWVKASHEGLRPIEAGRFVVHTAHYRARVPRVATSRATSFPPPLRGRDREGGNHTEEPWSNPRHRHRHGRARDRGRTGAAPARDGERHRSRCGARRARQCAAQWRALPDRGRARGGPFDAAPQRALRACLRQYPARAGAASGDPDRAQPGAGRPGGALGPAAQPGGRRARALHRARPDAQNAHPAGRLDDAGAGEA